jgi:hypothetical protein
MVFRFPCAMDSSSRNSLKSLNSAMEVHHHPHVEKKGFREYFLEFLMIFLAVTMGFFAESLREHIGENKKEKLYMRSLLEDISQDTLMLKYENRRADQFAGGIDSLRRLLYQDPHKIDLIALYRLQVTYSIIVNAPFNERTTSQLKAGAMNYVSNHEVANLISGYWTAQESIRNFIENIKGKIDHAAELRYAIFNLKYVEDMRVDSLHNIQAKISPDARLLTYDAAMLANYANRLAYVYTVLRNLQTELLKENERAKELISLIQKEFSL